MLGEFCQQDEILVGTMTANRTYVGMEDQIGLYARPLLQKANLAQSLTFIDLLHVTHAYASQTQIYQYYPIYKLAEDLGLQSNIQKRELYNTTFYFAKEQQNKEISTLLQPVKKGDSKAIAKYQLSLFTSSNDQLITVRLRYQKCVYFKKTMQHLLKRYLEIVQTMLDDPTQKLP